MEINQIVTPKELFAPCTQPEYNYIADDVIVFGMIPKTKTVVMAIEVSKGQLLVISKMDITGNIYGQGLNRDKVEALLFKNWRNQ